MSGPGDRERGVLVTGASTGIGHAAARLLAERGFRVFAGVRRAADAERLRSESPGALEPVMLDVTDAASVEAAAKLVGDAVGDAGLLGLTNNAGVAIGGIQEFLDLDELRRQLEVNVVGVAAVTRAFLPLVRRGRGRVVNVGSISGFLASPFLGPYAASKFALEALTDSLRRELRPWRIEVSLIEPGGIATPIWNKGARYAERVRASLPEHGVALYGDLFEKMESYVRRTTERAIPPSAVAEVVYRALTARRPRTRYRVGLEARLLYWVSRLAPDRALDAVVALRIGTGARR